MEMNCFICDLMCNLDVASGSYICQSEILNGISYTDLIQQLIGASFQVTIDEKDVLCRTCLILIEELDLYRTELDQIERILQRQIYRKYQIGQDEMRTCFRDNVESKAARSFSTGSNNEFVCRECLFRTNISDNIIPHYKFHRIIERRRLDGQFNGIKIKAFQINAEEENEQFYVEESVDDTVKQNCVELSPVDGSQIKEEYLDFDHCNDYEFLDESSLDVQNIHGFIESQYLHDTTDKISIKKSTHEDHSNQLDRENDQKYGLCKVCGIKLQQKKRCDHQQAIADGKSQIKCHICLKIFYEKTLLLDHIHSKHFICKKCNKEFPSKSKVDYHFEAEHSQKQLQCDQCMKLFKTINGLKRHYSHHTGEFLFNCEFCNKGCTTKKQYEDHRSIHTQEKRYVCTECGQSFISGSSFNIHRLWHKNPKPYACPECAKCFSSQPHLKVHRIRAHNIAEKPHQCHYCPKKFAAKYQMKTHEMSHTGAYRFGCTPCKKTFTKRIEYGKHLAKFHQDYSIQMDKKVCEYKIAIRPIESSDSDEKV